MYILSSSIFLKNLVILEISQYLKFQERENSGKTKEWKAPIERIIQVRNEQLQPRRGALTEEDRETARNP